MAGVSIAHKARLRREPTLQISLVMHGQHGKMQVWPVRCFFHLKGPSGTLLDEEGFEVSDVGEAFEEAREAIQEVREEQPLLVEGTWWLIVEDMTGAVHFVIEI